MDFKLFSGRARVCYLGSIDASSTREEEFYAEFAENSLVGIHSVRVIGVISAGRIIKSLRYYYCYAKRVPENPIPIKAKLRLNDSVEEIRELCGRA